MGYLAIARKWRPSRFEELVGQNHVVQTLKNAIAFNRVAHAYLFSGVRGVGKTSVARIFAMALRCVTSKDGTPCNVCDECRAISESRSIDVIEIDGASNNGVEAIRGIRENVAYSPSSGIYKIYIIDEVHMLSLSAFNALLKTLEEPPTHVIFIFATTEPHKIPVTILSRCQRFEFRRLTSQQIIKRLKEILDQENFRLSDDAFSALASYGDGSLRDALSLLDQVMSYFSQEGQKNITLDELQVTEALGISDTNTITSFLSLIISKDSKNLIQLIGKIYQSGVDLKKFAERCLEELRFLYLVVLAKEQKENLSELDLDIALSHLIILRGLAEKTNLLQIERMSQIMNKTSHQLGWSSLPLFVLEMAAIRMSRVDTLAELETSLLDGQQSLQIPALKEEEATEKAPNTALASPQTHAEPPLAANSLPPPEKALHGVPTGEPPDKNWIPFVDLVMKKRPLLGALLYHAGFQIEKSQSKELLITLSFAGGSFHEQQALDLRNRTDIEQLLKQFFGNHIKLSILSAQKDHIQSIDQQKLAQEAQLKKEAVQHPSVLQMKELLGAEIVSVNVKP